VRIPCPFCGPRGNEEFTYLGDASVRRPDPNVPGVARAYHD
jgi:sarcosine oxidase subunit delta